MSQVDEPLSDDDSPSKDFDESSLVCRMAHAIDEMTSEESLSESSTRDVLACLAMLARASAGTGSRNGGQSTDFSSEATNTEFPIRIRHFEVREMLGHGGFGVVFRAYDTALQREVALKLPRPESLASSETRRRFVREAQAAAILDHPGIVPVYDTGELGPLWYIACGLVRGPTLRQWLKDQGSPPNVRLAAKLVLPLAEAVQHAHNRGILHLDLKPSNVLLEPVAHESRESLLYQVRLSDFGLSGHVDRNESQSQSTGIAGTCRYMSPEQVRGNRKEISTATDVYGLGVILYELLVGEPPFLGEAGPNLFQRITVEEPRRIRNVRPNVPGDLEAICLKCLEKEPRARYSSVRDLADDLRRFLVGLPVSARRIGRLQRFARSCRRHPAVTGLTAAVIVSAMAGIFGIAYQWRQTQSHAAEARHQAAIAVEQRKRAEKHLAEAQQSLLVMAWMFQESSPFLAGEPHVLNELRVKLAGYYSQLVEGEASPEVRLPVLAACSTFNALAQDDNETTGPVHAAQFREAADRWWEVVRTWPGRPTYRRALSLHLLSMADYYRRTGKNEEATRCREEAQTALAPPWTGTDADAPACVDMATRLDDLAGTLRRAHREEDARCLKKSIVSLLAHVRTMLPGDHQVLMRWAKAQCRLAADVEQGRQGKGADAILAVAETDLARVFDWQVPDRELGLVLAEVLRRRAVIARDQKDLGAALEIFERADKVLAAAAAADAPTPGYRREHGLVLRGLGYVQLALGDKAVAFATMNRCREFYRQAQTNSELRTEGQVQYGRICADAGTLAIDLGREEDAEKCFAEAVEAFASVPGTTRWVMSDLRANAESATMLARMREAANRPDDAHELYERALGLWQKLHRREPRSPDVKQRLALVEGKLGGATVSTSAALDADTMAIDAEMPTTDSDDEP